MKRTHHDYQRDADEMFERLDVIRQDLRAAVKELKACQPGFPTSSGGAYGAPTLGEDGSPPGLERFVTRRDPAMADLAELDVSLAEARGLLARAHRIVLAWRPVDRSSMVIVEKVSGGECVVCFAYCSGAAEDRLRAGLCNACRMSYSRWRKDNVGGRHDWIMSKRAEQAQEVEVS